MVQRRLRQLVLCLALLPACSSAPGGASGSGGTSGSGATAATADCSELPSLEEEVRHATCDNYMGAARCCMRGEITEANVAECVGTYDWTIDRESHEPIAAPAACRGLVDATLDCANSLEIGRASWREGV